MPRMGKGSRKGASAKQSIMGSRQGKITMKGKMGKKGGGRRGY